VTIVDAPGRTRSVVPWPAGVRVTAPAAMGLRAAPIRLVFAKVRPLRAVGPVLVSRNSSVAVSFGAPYRSRV
jgi:hypothetical protein